MSQKAFIADVKPVRLERLLLSQDQLRELGIPYSRSQIWKQVRLGRFPKPISISSSRKAWLYSEVVAWLEAKKAERE